jgi:hypothetical protein
MPRVSFNLSIHFDPMDRPPGIASRSSTCPPSDILSTGEGSKAGVVAGCPPEPGPPPVLGRAHLRSWVEPTSCSSLSPGRPTSGQPWTPHARLIHCRLSGCCRAFFGTHLTPASFTTCADPLQVLSPRGLQDFRPLARFTDRSSDHSNPTQPRSNLCDILTPPASPPRLSPPSPATSRFFATPTPPRMRLQPPRRSSTGWHGGVMEAMRSRSPFLPRIT